MNHEIKFINSNYKELFRIPDGGRIVVTRPMSEMYPNYQEQWVGTCRYIDEMHVSIDNECYHICQFAEIQERIGAKVEPETEREVIGGYSVNQRTFLVNKIIKFGHNPKAPEPYGTWTCFKDENNRNNFGHYWSDKSTARHDYFLRCHSERTGQPYDHTTLMKKEIQELSTENRALSVALDKQKVVDKNKRTPKGKNTRER
jgi:hypothetical protein